MFSSIIPLVDYSSSGTVSEAFSKLKDALWANVGLLKNLPLPIIQYEVDSCTAVTNKKVHTVYNMKICNLPLLFPLRIRVEFSI